MEEMSKPLEKFLVYLSQTNDNCRETKSQWSEKILWRTATLLLNLYIRIKGGDKRMLYEISLVVN